MQAALSEKFLHLKSILQRFSDYFQQDFLPWAPSNNEQQDSSKTGFTQLGQHAAELLQNAKQLDEVRFVHQLNLQGLIVFFADRSS